MKVELNEQLDVQLSKHGFSIWNCVVNFNFQTLVTSVAFIHFFFNIFDPSSLHVVVQHVFIVGSRSKAHISRLETEMINRPT